MCQFCTIAARYRHVGREESRVFDLSQFTATATDDQSALSATAARKPIATAPFSALKTQDFSFVRGSMKQVRRSAHYEFNPIFTDDIHSQVIEKRIENMKTEVKEMKRQRN